MSKKLLMCLLVGIMLMSITGCGSGNTQSLSLSEIADTDVTPTIFEFSEDKFDVSINGASYDTGFKIPTYSKYAFPEYVYLQVPTGMNFISFKYTPTAIVANMEKFYLVTYSQDGSVEHGRVFVDTPDKFKDTIKLPTEGDSVIRLAIENEGVGVARSADLVLGDPTWTEK